MTNNGTDRVKLMNSLNITVLDGEGGDNLYLMRYGVSIPYNIMNFMLFNENKLVSDVLRRFREKQNDFLPNNSFSSDCDISESEIKINDVLEQGYKTKVSFDFETVPNDIFEKKKNIRNIIENKGLICSYMK